MRTVLELSIEASLGDFTAEINFSDFLWMENSKQLVWKKAKAV